MKNICYNYDVMPPLLRSKLATVDVSIFLNRAIIII